MQQELIAAREQELVRAERQGSRLVDLSRELEVRPFCCLL